MLGEISGADLRRGPLAREADLVPLGDEKTEPTLTPAEQRELTAEILKRGMTFNGKPLDSPPLSQAVSDALYRRLGHLGGNGKQS
jgi:hypothetical protein